MLPNYSVKEDDVCMDKNGSSIEISYLGKN
jgi:hypothetical protein